MTAGCPPVGAGGTGYSATGAAEDFVAGGTGANDTGNSVVEVGVSFGAAFLVGFVNFHPSPHVLYLLCI